MLANQEFGGVPSVLQQGGLEYLDQFDHGHELQSPAEAVLHRLGESNPDALGMH